MTPCQAIHAAIDRGLAASIRTGGHKITCSSGCYHCCAEAAYVERSEAEGCIAAIPPEERAGVIERLRVWVANYKASGIGKDPEPNVLKYRSSGLMCPLLKDGKCLVYADRPYACRGHCAIRDPALCASNATRLEQRFIYSPDLTASVFRSFAKLLGRYSADHLGCWLSELLLQERLESEARLELDVDV
jgi:hypothetical protein